MSHPFLQDSSIFRQKRRRPNPPLNIITTKPIPQLPSELWNEILLNNRRQVMKERIAEMEGKIIPMKEYMCECRSHYKYNKWGDPHGWAFEKPILATPRFFHEFIGAIGGTHRIVIVDVWAFWKYAMCKSIDVHGYEFSM